MKPIKDRWYKIDYKPNKEDLEFGCQSYSGIGQYTGNHVDFSEDKEIEDLVYEFELSSDLEDGNFFGEEFIIEEVSPLPTYQELYKFWLENKK